MAACTYCWKKMPATSIVKHERKCHTIKCLYCCHTEIAYSRSCLEGHVRNEHEEIYEELEKREYSGLLYVYCTVCKLKVLKTSLDNHLKEVHPPQTPVYIPFVHSNVEQSKLRSIRNLYQHVRSADVFFVFENHSRVAAHKCILASNSVVFYRMFYGELKEMGDVKIADASIEEFLVFLSSFYQSNMLITEKNVAEIMYLGNKYDGTKCIRACQEFLRLVLCTENVLNILGLAIMYNCDTLRQLCVEKVIKAGQVLIKMDCFYQCNRDVLKQVLATNFQGRNESTLLDSCIEWANRLEANMLCERENIKASELSNLRLQLGDCFDLIRFDSMALLEFIQCQGKYADMFTIDELKKIANAIAKDSGIHPDTSNSSIVSDVVDSVPQYNTFTHIPNSIAEIESMFGNKETADIISFVFETGYDENHPDTSISTILSDVVDSVPQYTFTHIPNSIAEIESMFRNKETADISFVFETGYDEEKRISAHKCILANISTEFDKLFFGPDKEKGDIRIRQDSANEFSVFLHSFYGKSMPLAIANVSRVMYFANEYNVQICLSACEDFLQSQLSNENVFLALELSYSYRRAKLYELCVKQIVKNYQLLFATIDFLNCNRLTIKHIVMMNFEVHIDFIIFEACMKWAKHGCEKANISASTENLVEMLGDILDLIRFTAMSTTEFIKCQIKYGDMFNANRLNDILGAIGELE